MNGFDWASLLPFITAASVALTVLVGIIGLRQGHYYKGRITKRGKRAVAVMVALGIVTLVSAFAGQQISAAKDKAEDEVRSRQFESQMASLRTVTAKLDSAENSLQDSLRRQEALAAAADRNLRLSQTLQTQARRNTDRVMRRIVEDTNRFTFANMSAMVVTQCPEPRPGLPRPVAYQLLILIEGRRGLAVVQQRESVARDNLVIFDQLEGALNNYDTLPPWEGSVARVQLRAVDHEFRQSLPAEERNLWSLQERNPGRSAVRCPFQLTLSIKGQWMLQTSGTLEEVSVGIFSARVRGVRPHLQAPLSTRWVDIEL